MLSLSLTRARTHTHSMNCKNPETTCNIEGKKKNMTLYLTCKGCGGRTDLDSAGKPQSPDHKSQTPNPKPQTQTQSPNPQSLGPALPKP